MIIYKTRHDWARLYMLTSQIIIAVFGVAAIWLTQQSAPHLKKYAPICGLVSQPFWFYVSWTSGSYGIFALCFFYTYAWATGFYNQWLKP